MAHLNNLMPADLTEEDRVALERMPKAVLYAIAKHLAAASCEPGYDDALESRAYLIRMQTEWQCLHDNKIVPQKPKKLTK
jgi:hypothetical protein